MPKGGFGLRKSTQPQLCGDPTTWSRQSGQFGHGQFCNEPWSLQAMEKRVYAVRDFYARVLKGTSHANPGWDEIVCGTLSAMRKLVGKKAQHVPQARPAAQHVHSECDAQ